MANPDTASDLAATFYAATLRPDPTLDPTSPRPVLHAYAATGRRLEDALLRPMRPAVVRCTTRSRSRTTEALVTVHDRHLLVIQDRRAVNVLGLQATEHHLVDIPMAQREGHQVIHVACHVCDRAHELPLRSLRRARTNDDSAPSGPLPLDPNDHATARYLAFAETTGALGQIATVFVRATPWRTGLYLEHFGVLPPHDTHWRRLIGTNTLPWAMHATGHDRENHWPDDGTLTVEARRVAQAHR